MADWWIPAAERTRARSDRPQAHASSDVRRYLAGRLLQAVIVVFLVTTVTFVLIHLAPGDPISIALDRPGVTEAVRQHWREEFGFDQPIGEQYVRWIGNRRARRPRILVQVQSPRARRARRRDAAHAAARRARAGAQLRARSSSSACSRPSDQTVHATDGWDAFCCCCSPCPISGSRWSCWSIFAYRPRILPPSGIVDARGVRLHDVRRADARPAEASRASGRHAHAARHRGDRAPPAQRAARGDARATGCAPRSPRD